MSKIKVLITGAGGFVGSELIKRLGNEDFQVYGLYNLTEPQIGHGYRPDNCEFIKCDLTGENDHQFGQTFKRQFHIEYKNEKYHIIKEIMGIIKPDIVVHLAGSSSPSSGDFVINNVLTTQKLCESCRGVDKFLYASSVVVYDDSQTYCKEHHTLAPRSLYGATKLAGEHIVNLPQWDIKDRSSLRLTAVVGNVENLTHGALKHLTKKMIAAKLGDNTLSAFYNSIKPYIHVNDVCEYIVKVIKGESPVRKAINVCGNYSIEIQTIIDILDYHLTVKLGLGELYSDGIFIGTDNKKTWMMSTPKNKVQVNWELSEPEIYDNPVLSICSELFRKDYGKICSSAGAIYDSVEEYLKDEEICW